MAEQVNLVETEFILREALQLKIPMRLHGAGKTATSRVQEIRKDSIVMDAQGVDVKRYSPWENLSVYFDFRGKDMTFTTRVLRLDCSHLALSYPEHLLRSPMRKYPRVPCPRGFSLELTLENEKVHLNYPQCGEYSDVSLPDLHQGLDVSTLNSLIESFRKKSINMASECRVVLFKGRDPAGIEEKLLASYGKTLFIPSSRSPLPSADPYPESRIITAGMLSDYEGPDALIEGSRFERALISKIGRAVNAEVWCPIQYYQYVVGYVYMANKADRPKSMDFTVVDCAWEFARILAYYLKTCNYFKPDESSDPVTHAAGIVDLSAAGCLLCIPQTALALRIKIGSVLDIRLIHPDGSFSTRGKVVRRYDEKDGAFYGVLFLGFKAEDMRLLYPRIYEVPYQESMDGSGEARLPTGGAT
jgi:hypothetical protein